MEEDLTKLCRTKQWVSSLPCRQIEVDAPGEDTRSKADVSPVNGLAKFLAGQNLDSTPRRRLSLHADSSGDSSILLPQLTVNSEQAQSLGPNVKPDESNDRRAAEGDRPSSGAEPRRPLKLLVGGQMIHLHKKQSTESICDGDELRSPILLSPAPSSVFFDEETQDSGYSGSNVAKSSADTLTTSSFCSHARSTSQTSVGKSMGFACDDGFGTEEFDAKESGPGKIAEPYASLFSGTLKSFRTARSKSYANEDTMNKRGLTDIVEEFDSPFLFPRGKRLTAEVSENKDPFQTGSTLKRYRSVLGNTQTSTEPVQPGMPRCFSEADAMNALQKGAHRRDLIGDFSTVYALPTLARPRIPDLISIEGDVLAQLLEGCYGEVSKFKIIDCRYPYEYDGGHVVGAINIYTKEQLREIMLDRLELRSSECREIVIFYCEYSQERGPRMSRYLRAMDRRMNEAIYPRLYYPEIYLLEGGYKNFYPRHVKHCEPRNYVPMLHKDHAVELRKFRAKSKSWTSGALDAPATAIRRRPGRRTELQF
uniref:M-phase inducer phosphatase n=1 Tax=Trichuris muris TaxID=70415 RepID=A0A5S6QNN6_TRIMR